MIWDKNKVPTIPEFFSGQEIFLTGGSGFMGKAIIEKLLYSCSNISKIFILLRSKRNLTLVQRVEKLVSNEIFDRIREKDPKLLQKIIPIHGDFSELDLGISDDDMKLLENVSIVMNSAASVRFDDPLKKAIILNTRGTRELIHFAENLRNLKVFVHISTTYCNPDRLTIEEKIYPPYADWRLSIKMAETMDQELLDTVAPHYMTFQPNTYTFTKGLSEQIVNEYKDRLPIIIFRPSIVTTAVTEPFRGWIDNFNGPAGFILSVGLGLNRVLYLDPDASLDYIPLDVVIRSLLVATWKRGVETLKHEPPMELPIYNCSCGENKGITANHLIEHGLVVVKENPLHKMVWTISATFTKCWYWYLILSFFAQVLPAFFIDGICVLLKKKPQLLSIQRRIKNVTTSLAYFNFHTWTFRTENCYNLMNDIKEEDLSSFSFDFYKPISTKDYICIAFHSGRENLLHEKEDDLAKAKIKYWILFTIDRILKYSLGFAIIYYFLNKYNVFSRSYNYFQIE